jgi:hypothetical protein
MSETKKQNEWFNTNIVKFEDKDGTVFIKGPFKIKGQTYDYMLQEKGIDSEEYIDYCTTSQMLFWKVSLSKILETN